VAVDEHASQNERFMPGDRLLVQIAIPTKPSYWLLADRSDSGRTCPAPSERRLDNGNTLWVFTSCLAKARSLRVRAGAARTFGPLFLVFSGLMLALGAIFWYDAFAHPRTADAGQILIGSVCLAYCWRCSFWFGKVDSLR
jgi:hypothetical protein